MKGIKTIELGNEKWIAVSEVAEKLGRTRNAIKQTLVICSCQFSLQEAQTPAGKRKQTFMRESDLLQVITALRATGEFADSIRHIQQAVTSKGIQATLETPKREVIPFQKFPAPIQIPAKPIRACVVEYVRMVGKVTGKDYNVLFRSLYTEFKYRFGVDPFRHSGYASSIAKLDDLEKLPELYALAREMFDNQLPTEALQLEA